MTRISSHSTFFYKRIFPAFWFGFLGLMFCIIVARALSQQKFTEVIPALVGLIVMAAFGYFIMKGFVLDLADVVYDCGDSILVKNRGREFRFALSDFMSVGYEGMVNPPRITLALCEESDEFGNMIAFIAPFRWWPYSMSPIARDLMLRVYNARE